MIAYLDTHVAVALCTQPKKKIGTAARRVLLRGEDVRVSPIVILELQMLREIGRVNARPEAFIEPLKDAFRLQVCDTDFARVVDVATSFAWTRDPFDRLIAAHAKTARGILLTNDEKMRAHCSFTVWD